MIYLLDWRDFEPIIAFGNQIGFRLKYDNIRNIIRNKLTLAAQTNELINTQWLRCIGKTYELIRFAERNNYIVLHPQANGIKEEYKYDFIYEPNINKLRGISNLNVVIDEGVNNIEEIKNAGFNIVTGYYIPKEEDEQSFKNEVTNVLTNEIKELTKKIQKARQEENYGTYKNLIQAYSEILRLIEYINK